MVIFQPCLTTGGYPKNNRRKIRLPNVLGVLYLSPTVLFSRFGTELVGAIQKKGDVTSDLMRDTSNVFNLFEFHYESPTFYRRRTILVGLLSCRESERNRGTSPSTTPSLLNWGIPNGFRWFVMENPIWINLVSGLEHFYYFPIYWESHHPNWRTIFFRGVA